MPTQAWPPYRVRTHNPSLMTENRMHSDEVARAHGFKGALVPGVTVFSHMTHPLVERYGEAWLARGTAEVSFARPAYEGDWLTISTAADASEKGGGAAHVVTCTNEQGVELARMTASLPDAAGAVDARAQLAPAPPAGDRPLVTWELMEIDRPFPALAWSPSQADNDEWCRDARDELPIYRAGFMHPGLTLRSANLVLRQRFLLPAWIHTASRMMLRQPLRTGVGYEVRAIPEEKWQRKGHELVRLYVAIRAGEVTVAEIIHTAIFRPRQAAAA